MRFSADIADYFTFNKREPLAALVLLKALYLVALAKLLNVWVASDVVFADFSKAIPESWLTRIILSGSTLGGSNIDLFVGIFAAFLVFALVFRPDYRINIVFFWFELNYFRMLHPVSNGSDYIMLALAILAIPLASRPGYASARFQIVSTGLFNFSRIMIKIQILSVYFISGWDKLINPAWRSGEAFEYIAHLETMFHPAFGPLLESEAMQFTLSWMTIGFELLFIPLVLIARTRLAILAVGVGFHIVIWLMFGLPGFAWVMIVSYAIFLKDRDFDRFPKWIRPSPL